MNQVWLNAGLLPYRNDNNAWLGETKDREIGFFNREHVEELMDENFDGRYKLKCKFLVFALYTLQAILSCVKDVIRNKYI